MKFSREYIGKKVILRTRFGKIEGVVQEYKSGVIVIDGTRILEGQIVAVEVMK
jgi:FKBP-type peptidyl-prolyl cis-trans isomerase 2